MTILIIDWVPSKEPISHFQQRMEALINQVITEEDEELVGNTYFKEADRHYFILEFDGKLEIPEFFGDESGYFENLQWSTIGVAVLLSTLSGIISSVLLSL